MTLLKTLEVNQTLHTLALKVTQPMTVFVAETYQLPKKNMKSFPDLEGLQEYAEFIPKIASLGKLVISVWSPFLLSWHPIHAYFNQNNKLPYEFFRMLKCILMENTTLTKLYTQVLISSICHSTSHSFSQRIGLRHCTKWNCRIGGWPWEKWNSYNVKFDGIHILLVVSDFVNWPICLE